MGLLGYIAGGVASSVGQHLQRDALLRREEALEELRQSRADQRGEREFQQRRQLQSEGAAIQGREQRETLTHGGKIQAERQEATQQFQLTLEERQARNREALERLRSSLDMSETEARMALEEANLAAREGRTVSEWRISSQGSLVGYNSEGEIIAQTRPGRFNPDNVPRNAGRSGGGAAARPAATAPIVNQSGAAAAASPPPAQSGARADEAALRDYGEVVDRLYPNVGPTERLRLAREMAERYRR